MKFLILFGLALGFSTTTFAKANSNATREPASVIEGENVQYDGMPSIVVTEGSLEKCEQTLAAKRRDIESLFWVISTKPCSPELNPLGQPIPNSTRHVGSLILVQKR